MTDIGMDKKYTICDHSFTSTKIMTLSKALQIDRYVHVLAPQSKYFGKDLEVIKTEYFGNWYQVKLCDLDYGWSRKYTFPNSKIQVSDITLLEFENALKTRDIPKDYIEREFKEKDIVFYREFFRVKRVFGDFMILDCIKSEARNRTVVRRECSMYLVIDDPLVHLSI